MYIKPEVVRFGTLRELTRIGLHGSDGGIHALGRHVYHSHRSWLKNRRS